MTPLALSLLLAASVGQHDADPCREIRTVLRLAKQEGLDRTTLRILRDRYCRAARWDDGDRDDDRRRPQPPPPPVPAVSADCRALGVMTRLARMTDASLVAQVDRQRAYVCAANVDLAPFSWTNGLTAKFSDGTWRYPNGVTARFTDGTWRYANGVTAKFPDGTWRYPNGVTARYSDGTWLTPDGRRREVTQLLMEARVPADLYRQINAMGPDERDLTIVEAVWAATR